MPVTDFPPPSVSTSPLLPSSEQSVDLIDKLTGWAFAPDVQHFLASFIDVVSGVEAGLVFLLGVIAQASGGRVLIAAVGGAVAANLLDQYGLWTAQPDWIASLVAMAIVIGLVHLVLSILLGEQGAAQAFVTVAGVLFIVFLIKPLSLVRLIGGSGLVRVFSRRRFHGRD